MQQTLLILGGLIGMAVCMAAGLLSGLDIGQAFFNGALGCLAGGWAGQWLGGMMQEAQIAARRKKSTAVTEVSK